MKGIPAESTDRSVDAASLAAYRIGLGAVLLWGVLRYALAGKIDEYYVDPTFHFSYLGFEWVRPWPAWGLYLHFGLLGLCAFSIAVGFATRTSAFLFTLGFAYLFLLEKGRYLNHHYLVILLAFLLAAVPTGRAFGVDAWRRGVCLRPPRWSLAVFRAQIGLVYFFAGVAKLNPDWLRGRPLDEWLPRRADLAVIGPLVAQPWSPFLFSYGGLVLDLLAWPLLACRRTRLPAFLVICSFHLLNATLFSIGIFPWLMIAATTIFFEPDWPRRLLRLSPAKLAVRPAPRPGAAPLVRTLIGVWFVVQIALPLRHFLYPGYVSWTEEGHAFSWHMKLRDKDGRATFVVEYPGDGGTEIVDPRGELTDWQYRKLCGRPDLILQYAHHLAAEGTSDGRRPVVRANAQASLNGRPPQPLVDPTVDLASVRRGLGHADWIVPLRE